jgi:hypothetical protein
VQYRLIDCIAGCYDPAMPGRLRSAIDTIVLHRYRIRSVDDWKVGAHEIAEFHRAQPALTGSPFMPYHFVVRAPPNSLADIVVEQALPVCVKAPHALQWNARSVGIAVIGDFQKNRPTEQQRLGTIWLCRRLMDRLGRNLRIDGHTVLPKSTNDLNKVCPGQHLGVKAVASHAYAQGGIALDP